MKTSGLLQFTVTPSNHRYTAERCRRFLLDFQRGLEDLPDAISVSAAEFPVLAGQGDDNTVTVQGYRPHAGEDMNPRWNMVLPSFFSTMGVPLIAGREFTERDAGGAGRRTPTSVVIVNETFVERFLPNQDPIGHRIGWGGEGNPYVTEIVGVVRDVRTESLKGTMRPFTYVPAIQNFFDWVPPEMTFYVRTKGSPTSLASGARKVLSKLDPEMPIFDVRTLEDQIDQTNFKDRALTTIACAFAVLATLLAAVGLYGVTAYSVARRRPEIGLRLALGAERGPIIRMVLQEVMWLAGIGIAAGVPLAFIFGRISESLLFALKGSDPWIVLTGVLVIAAVSAVAGYLPARRAARIDPMEALRG
jgi:predicted permease